MKLFRTSLSCSLLALAFCGLAQARELVSFYVDMTTPDVPPPYNNAPNFEGCDFDFVDFPVDSPNKDSNGIKVHDDGTTSIHAIRDPTTWRQSDTDPGMGRLMTVSGSVYGTPNSATATYLAAYTKTDVPGHYPEFLSAFQDGGVRPSVPSHPPTDDDDRLPANQTIRLGTLSFDPVRSRAYADVEHVTFNPTTRAFTFFYRTGGSTTITIIEAAASRTRLKIDIGYAPASAADSNVAGQIFEITSMFIDSGTNDVAKVRWQDVSGVETVEDIMDFQDAEVREITLFRDAHSDHNTRGPDLRAFNFTYDDSCGIPDTVLVEQRSYPTLCPEEDNVVLGFKPQNISPHEVPCADATPQGKKAAEAAAPKDTWSQYYDLASYYYGFYAAYGYYDYAAAFYSYYYGLGDYYYHLARKNQGPADFALYNGVGLYFLYLYGSSGYSYYYYYLALAYYYYYAGFGDYATAAAYYNAFIAYAFGG